MAAPNGDDVGEGTDPHVHVQADLGGAAVSRQITAATFGLAADAPARVSTGCGLTVTYASTSTRPGSVTCLACREYAHRRHLDAAAWAEQWRRQPTTDADLAAHAARAAAHHRDLARQFADPRR